VSVRSVHRSCSNAAEALVDRQVQAGRGERRAFLTAKASYTYADLLDHVERAGFMLSAAGLRPLDRVLIVLPDSFEAVTILLAAMRIGAVPIPIHTRLTNDDYAFMCADCRPALAVVGDDHLQRLLAVRETAKWPDTIVAVGEGPFPEGVFPARDAMAAGHRCSPAPTRPDDVALMQYTSGSTGKPKGVVHLHRGVLALPEGFGCRLDLTEDDVCFSAAKLFFGYGLGNSVFFPLGAGASALLRPEPSEPISVLDAIDVFRPTVFFGGPTLYTAMLDVREVAERLDLASVRLFVSAGEALGASVARRWKRAFDRPILDGLGSTECLHIFIAGEPGRLQVDHVGTVVPPYEVRLLDEHGVPAGPEAVGELYVRGPSNGACYWERPSSTRDTMVDGWVRTGDLMTQLADGTYRYVGRRDDDFKVRGERIAPLEVEACLNSHRAVAESAVVPRLDRRGLTIACAFVKLQPPARPSPELARSLRAHVRAQLAVHKIPRMVEFMDELPRSSTGKLARYRLRAQSHVAPGRGV
jgi:benzoate-CoA ligase family protein